MLLTLVAAAVITVVPNAPQTGPGSQPPTLLLRACPQGKAVLTPAARTNPTPELYQFQPLVIRPKPMDPSRPRFDAAPHPLGKDPDAFRCNLSPPQGRVLVPK